MAELDQLGAKGVTLLLLLFHSVNIYRVYHGETYIACPPGAYIPLKKKNVTNVPLLNM